MSEGVEIIEVGKTYAVSAYFKKSMIEIEMFKHEDGRGLNTEIGWRNGTFIIRVEDEFEKNALQESLGENGDTWDYDDYSNIEMDSTFDGCWEEFIFYGDHFTEEQQEALEKEYEDQLDEGDWQSRYEFLEERGFESHGCNWMVDGGMIAEVSEYELEALDAE